MTDAKPRLRRPKFCPSCKRNPSEKAHTCPYREDVGGDSDSKCHCCAECQRNCADDI